MISGSLVLELAFCVNIHSTAVSARGRAASARSTEHDRKPNLKSESILGCRGMTRALATPGLPGPLADGPGRPASL